MGAELTAKEIQELDVPIDGGPGDGETRLVEACVLYGPVQLLAIRSLLATMRVANHDRAMQDMAASGIATLRNLQTAAFEESAYTLAAWALVAQSDLLRRAGLDELAGQQLGDVRDVYEEMNDAIGLAVTHLVEGDWYATPGSSPEALGFLLDAELQPAAEQDTGRARACYDRAANLLDSADAPLAAGALALRRAALAFFADDIETQRRWLDEAAVNFEAVGGEANRRLVEVHKLVADVAQGEVARTMLRAGTRWDLAPRGPIAEILAWSEEEGSRSFATGLGRLLQRAGERWQRMGSFERAEACCSLALPLISCSRGVPPAAVLMVLAQLDIEREQGARALVRLEQAIGGFEVPQEIGDYPERWLRAVYLCMGIVAAQMSRTGSSSFARGIPGLERAVDRLEQLMQVPGVPKESVSEKLLKDQAGMLEAIATSHRDKALEEVRAGMDVAMTAEAKTMLSLAAQGARDQVEQGRCAAILNRARQLRQQGWEGEAERWYDDAINKIQAAGPALSHMAVLAEVQRGNEDGARLRFDEVASHAVLPEQFLAPLAIRAGRAEYARTLFEKLDSTKYSDLSWRDVADRAEVALETGNPERALELATKAIARFERRVARLARDPDRIAASDDVSVAFVCLVAARACFAIADSREEEGDMDGRRDAIEEALLSMERGRAFAMPSLVNTSTNASRSWQKASTEWSSAFERLLFAYELQGSAGADDLLQELSAADERLSTIESRLPSEGRSALSSIQKAVDVAALRAKLPDDTCILEYHVVGPRIASVGVTRDDLARSYVHVDRAVLEPAVNTLLRSCAMGSADADSAATLSRILLDPLTDVLRASERIIVVPFGPLHSIPFHALPLEGRSLGETHVLSYVPASSLLSSRSIDGPLRGSGAVIVGDPEFKGRPNLKSLPGAVIEARDVARRLDTNDCLIGPQATEDALRPLLVGRAVVHLAAHGHLDDVAPSMSSIILAGRDELTVSDLIGLRIDAGLAVLSACDTGRGVATLGGDVVGLGRGLLAAGIERSIVSLWPVDDIVACVTMSLFYGHLERVIAPARALALAQRDVRNMTGDEIAACYRNLGCEDGATTPTRRRSGGSMHLLRPRGIPLHPAFEEDDDEMEDDCLVQNLDGSLERVWAPFVLVGV